MGRFELLTNALRVIEEGLNQDLTPQEVADRCYCSLSTLQKLFHRTAHLGIADYITRRRITLAAKDLLCTRDTVLEIALRYGYESHEVFLRAFRRLWGETPSRFRQTRSFSDLYPKYIIVEGDQAMSIRKGFDPAQLYDALAGMDNTMVILFDTYHLLEINEQYGRAAGDLVIAECLRRIDANKAEGMLLLRIGGDEYVLLTGYEEESAAKSLAERVLQENGRPISFEEQEIPVGLHYGLTRVEKDKNLNPEQLMSLLSETSMVR